jgi:hypothetical protein
MNEKLTIWPFLIPLGILFLIFLRKEIKQSSINKSILDDKLKLMEKEIEQTGFVAAEVYSSSTFDFRVNQAQNLIVICNLRKATYEILKTESIIEFNIESPYEPVARATSTGEDRPDRMSIGEHYHENYAAMYITMRDFANPLVVIPLAGTNDVFVKHAAGFLRKLIEENKRAEFWGRKVN